MNLRTALMFSLFCVTGFAAGGHAASRAVNPVVHTMEEKPSAIRSFFGRVFHLGGN
jgi:hypothetical protein